MDLEREVGPKFDRDTWASVKAAAATNAEQAPRNRSHKRKKPPSPTDKSSSSPNSTKAVDEIILRPPGFVDSQSRDDSGSEESRSQDLSALVMDLEHGLKRMTIGTAENRFHGEARFLLCSITIHTHASQTVLRYIRHTCCRETERGGRRDTPP